MEKIESWKAIVVKDSGESFGLEFIVSESELFKSIPKSDSKPIRKIFWISFKANQFEINPTQYDSL